MSNICAGIGRGQMTVARDHIAHHRHVAQLYKEAFADMEGIAFHDELPGMHTDCEPNCNVEALRLTLLEQGIESRPLWKPMHKQPIYKDATAYHTHRYASCPFPTYRRLPVVFPP